MRNKKVIVVIAVIIIAIICVASYLGIRTIKRNKYTKANEYEVGGIEFPSINKAIGEKEVIKYSHEKSNVEKLELTFKDPDKDITVDKYMETIKDNGNYIDMRTSNENIKQIASTTDTGLITIQTETTSDGFILTIEVGEGNIKIDPIE